MADLVNLLLDPDIKFFRLALLVAALASVAFGIMGTYVVTRRISYLAGAIAHCVFGGIGAGLFLQNRMGLVWFDPVFGAVAAAVLAAVVIGLVGMYADQREDTVIGALWAVGMAAGLIFIDLTPGYFDITSYLFGDILLLSRGDLIMVILLDVLVLLMVVFFYNYLLAVCFDNEFAVLRGVPAGFYYLLMLIMTALTVVMLVRVVGIIMVIALLTIPAAIAGFFARTLWRMMMLAVVLCLIFSWAGLGLSCFLNLSSGPVIILVAGSSYLFIVIVFWAAARFRPGR